jgi:hypothetical protein
MPHRMGSSIKVMENDTRTPAKIIETLSWWYKYFLPHELVYVFYLNRHWSIYDSERNRRIAIEFRNSLETNYNNEIIQSLLMFFNSHPDIKLLQENIINDNLFQTRNFIHIIPFTNICPLCKRLLSTNDSDSRQVKVICEQGEVLYGELI